jgi:hypothetical protein
MFWHPLPRLYNQKRKLFSFLVFCNKAKNILIIKINLRIQNLKDFKDMTTTIVATAQRMALHSILNKSLILSNCSLFTTMAV